MEPQYMIGLTVALLKPLPWYGIPYPMSHSYLPFSVRRKCGDGTYKGYGFPRAGWEWSRLNSSTLWNLMSLFDNDTDASVSLYVCTYKDVGYNTEYANFLVIMPRPLDGAGKSVFPRSLRNGIVNYSNIAAAFEHMEEV